MPTRQDAPYPHQPQNPQNSSGRNNQNNWEYQRNGSNEGGGKVRWFTPSGFPSPADDHIEAGLSLDDLIIKHPAATFFLRMRGNVLKDLGILEGDTLVVDRAERPVMNSIVVAVVDGEFHVRRYVPDLEHGRIWLAAANEEEAPILVHGTMVLEIWGVVISSNHNLMPKSPQSPPTSFGSSGKE